MITLKTLREVSGLSQKEYCYATNVSPTRLSLFENNQGELSAEEQAQGALAGLLPYRERPFFDPALHFQWPYHVDADQFIRWSSFPSDHAALFSALAMGLFFRNRRAGAVVFAYVVFGYVLPQNLSGLFM